MAAEDAFLKDLQVPCTLALALSLSLSLALTLALALPLGPAGARAGWLAVASCS